MKPRPKSQEFLFIVIMFVAVIGFGWLTWNSLIFSPQETQTIMIRQPASLNPSTSTLAANHISTYIEFTTQTLYWQCEPQEFSIPSHVTHIRIVTQKCNPHYHIESLNNLLNQYSGSIFNLENGEQSSDFIHISEGQNVLEILMRNKKDDKNLIQKISIHRAILNASIPNSAK